MTPRTAIEHFVTARNSGLLAAAVPMRNLAGEIFGLASTGIYVDPDELIGQRALSADPAERAAAAVDACVMAAREQELEWEQRHGERIYCADETPLQRARVASLTGGRLLFGTREIPGGRRGGSA